MLVDIDQELVRLGGSVAPDIALMERDQIERLFRQAVTTECQQLRIEKFAVNALDPAGLAADIPWCSEVARPVFQSYFHPVTRFKPAHGGIHGSPHLESNSANLRSISSRVRIFFSTRIASMLAIQRS